MRLSRINFKYEKDNLQMKSHMMATLSNEYDSVIVKFRGDLSETPLAKLRKEVVLQFKTLVNAGGTTILESVLNTNSTFKGICRNCGKIGLRRMSAGQPRTNLHMEPRRVPVLPK